MKRRDFLRLRARRAPRTVELSGQQLHMQYLERIATGGSPDTGGRSGEDFDSADLDPAEEGEPPTAFEGRTTEQIFAKLRRDLEDADVLHVTGHRWLSEGDGELLQEFDRLVSSFRARGGRVEFG